VRKKDGSRGELCCSRVGSNAWLQGDTYGELGCRLGSASLKLRAGTVAVLEWIALSDDWGTASNKRLPRASVPVTSRDSLSHRGSRPSLNPIRVCVFFPSGDGGDGIFDALESPIGRPSKRRLDGGWTWMAIRWRFCPCRRWSASASHFMAAARKVSRQDAIGGHMYPRGVNAMSSLRTPGWLWTTASSIQERPVGSRQSARIVLQPHDLATWSALPDMMAACNAPASSGISTGGSCRFLSTSDDAVPPHTPTDDMTGSSPRTAAHGNDVGRKQ